jgi:tellurite resistance protein TehA-like permease
VKKRFFKPFMAALDEPADALREVGPNWFAVVMGTGVMAVATTQLPQRFRPPESCAQGLWILTAVLMIAVLLGTALHWRRHPDRARRHADDPRMAPLYAAPSIALLLLGSGCLVAGRSLIGEGAAVAVDSALWVIGTAAGLLAFARLPILSSLRSGALPGWARAIWLLPVLPPLVAATTGAALIPFLPGGALRTAMLLCCLALFALGSLASTVAFGVLIQGRSSATIEPPEAVPAAWILLGPLALSVTGVLLLRGRLVGSPDVPLHPAIDVVSDIYAWGAWALAILWLLAVGAETVRALRGGLPFNLTWWCFVLPLGALVVASSALALEFRLGALRWIAALLYLLLIAIWATTLGRTLRLTWSGELFARAVAACDKTL